MHTDGRCIAYALTANTEGKGRGSVPRERVMPHQRTPERWEPRTEAEIIPPDHRFEQPEGGKSGIRVSVIGRSGERIYSAKPGPLTGLVAGIVLGALLVMILFFALSLFLIATRGWGVRRHSDPLERAPQLLAAASIGCTRTSRSPPNGMLGLQARILRERQRPKKHPGAAPCKGAG